MAFRQEANDLCDVKQAHKSGTPGAREVAQLVIGIVRMSIVAGSILVGASFLPKTARADI